MNWHGGPARDGWPKRRPAERRAAQRWAAWSRERLTRRLTQELQQRRAAGSAAGLERHDGLSLASSWRRAGGAATASIWQEGGWDHGDWGRGGWPQAGRDGGWERDDTLSDVRSQLASLTEAVGRIETEVAALSADRAPPAPPAPAAEAAPTPQEARAAWQRRDARPWHALRRLQGRLRLRSLCLLLAVGALWEGQWKPSEIVREPS